MSTKYLELLKRREKIMSVGKNPEFEKIVMERYQQMIDKGLFVDILEEEKFGQLSVFIDKKPNFPLISFKFDTHDVWVGAESLK